MNRVINYLKNYIGVISIVLALCILLTYSLSYFKVNTESKRAAEMYIGELKYNISIDETSTNTLTVPSGETIVDIDLTNQNEIKTYYKLLYLKNANISISYFNQTKNTSEEITNYKAPSDVVESKSQNSLKLKIINNSSSNQTLTFKVSGGYSTNTLADVEVPNTYTEITSLETPSTNTYFCKTNETLTQGLEYVDGQYTYGYKKQGNISSTIAWTNINNDGWGVQLTDKTSTDAVTSKVCTYINNKPIISTSYTFYNSKAISLDLSDFDTSNVNDMTGMFNYSQATTLDLSNFDTSKVTNMSKMFYGSKVTTLDVNNFNTSKVTNMYSMLREIVVEIIDISSFDTSKVTDMSYMFSSSKVTTLDVSNFNTSNVTNMKNMFSSSKATTIKGLEKFNTSNVTNMSNMFYGSEATTLDVSNFNTSNVTNMNGMFAGSQATVLDVSGFNTSKVTDMSYMFMSNQATTLDVSGFDTSNVTNMYDMFSYSQATTLDVSSFDTSNVTNMYGMFRESKATTLDVSKFNTNKVIDMRNMFYSSKATTLDLSSFDTSNVLNMSAMFSRSNVITLDLSSFDTSKVTDMSEMFSSCSKLKTIYASNKFNINSVTKSINMFLSASKLIGGSGTTYNSSYIDKTYARIDGGTSSPGYFTNVSQKPTKFGQDNWATIIANVKTGNISDYKVGNTKTIDMGTYGTHTLRIANTSTPSECSTSGFSQTTCGFVLEFADIITTYKMNDTATNVGGWPASSMRTFVNNDIYNSLPSDLKNGIIDTIVISSHGSQDSSNFTSTDKLYLLSTAEIYSDFDENINTANNLTRQLDYYKNERVTESNYSKVIKMYNSTAKWWWLRSASSSTYVNFFSVADSGGWGVGIPSGSGGVSVAFRIG